MGDNYRRFGDYQRELTAGMDSTGGGTIWPGPLTAASPITLPDDVPKERR